MILMIIIRGEIVFSIAVSEVKKDLSNSAFKPYWDTTTP